MLYEQSFTPPPLGLPVEVNNEVLDWALVCYRITINSIKYEELKLFIRKYSCNDFK